MPKTSDDELSERQVAGLMDRAQSAVDDGWNPQEHLPASMFQFLEPLTIATGQGFFTTLIQILGALPALCNGATIQLWPGRPTPLMVVVLQVAAAPKRQEPVDCIGGGGWAVKIELVTALFVLLCYSFWFIPVNSRLSIRAMITCWKGPRRWQQKSSKISHDNSPPSKVCPFRVSPSEFFHRCSSDWAQVDWGAGRAHG